jgi:hypothetical protein
MRADHQLFSTLTMLVAVCETVALDLDQPELSLPVTELADLRGHVEQAREVAVRVLRSNRGAEGMRAEA